MIIGVIRLDGVFTGAHIAPEKGMYTNVGVIRKINGKMIETSLGSFDASQVTISIAAVPIELLATVRYPNDRQYALSSVEESVNRIANLMPGDALDAVKLIAQIQSVRAAKDSRKEDFIEPSQALAMVHGMLRD